MLLKEGAIVQKTNKKSLQRTPMKIKVGVQLLSLNTDILIWVSYTKRGYHEMCMQCICTIYILLTCYML